MALLRSHLRDAAYRLLQHHAVPGHMRLATSTLGTPALGHTLDDVQQLLSLMQQLTQRPNPNPSPNHAAKGLTGVGGGGSDGVEAHEGSLLAGHAPAMLTQLWRSLQLRTLAVEPAAAAAAAGLGPRGASTGGGGGGGGGEQPAAAGRESAAAGGTADGGGGQASPAGGAAEAAAPGTALGLAPAQVAAVTQDPLYLDMMQEVGGF